LNWYERLAALKAGLFFRRPSSPLLRIGVLAIDRLLTGYWPQAAAAKKKPR
jgi:hypothetical protein